FDIVIRQFIVYKTNASRGGFKKLIGLRTVECGKIKMMLSDILGIGQYVFNDPVVFFIIPNICGTILVIGCSTFVVRIVIRIRGIGGIDTVFQSFYKSRSKLSKECPG